MNDKTAKEDSMIQRKMYFGVAYLVLLRTLGVYSRLFKTIGDSITSC